MNVIERFEEKIIMDGCWYWAAALDRYGYGKFNFLGKTSLAHRVSYSFFVGQIPQKLHLDHLCRNRACVNPEHLEPVTNKENHARGLRAQSTHCRRGHLFDPRNTRWDARGGRRCRTCDRDRKREVRRGL